MAPGSSPHAAAMSRRFARHAPLYDPTRWALLLGRRRAPALLAGRRARRILDVGCGTGVLLLPLASRADEVIGVDCAPAMLQRARARCVHLPNVRIVDAEYGRDPTPTGGADAIVLSYSLSMIPDPLAVLDRAVADLGAGGRIVVVDFLDAPRGLARWIASHGVGLGPQRRDALRRRFTPLHEEQHRAWAGWRWYVFVGSPVGSRSATRRHHAAHG